MANDKKKKIKNKPSKSKIEEVKQITNKSRWKDKIALFILISEVLVAVGMLIMIFSREAFTMFKGSKLIWGMYLLSQIILAFTILNKKNDETKGIFHLESILVTITYLLVV